MRERTFWGGLTAAAFRNSLFRGVSRLGRAVPVDPRPARVGVTFGAPADPAALAADGSGEAPRERIASGLRERVRALAEAGGPRGPSG